MDVSYINVWRKSLGASITAVEKRHFADSWYFIHSPFGYLRYNLECVGMDVDGSNGEGAEESLKNKSTFKCLNFS